ncbi:uncharacterized protein [Solanum lycopersicum]|uniref:uncharacterized protein n=1 Tax=Solanum lycopersicum TaxID=4081 RepID=UPI00374919E0
MSLEQGGMYVAAYEAKFHALSRSATHLLTTKEERIRLSVKGINSELQVLTPETRRPTVAARTTLSARPASTSNYFRTPPQNLIQDKNIIDYVSRHLKVHERNYPAHNLDLVEVVVALMTWQHYLYGVKCEMLTDDYSLQHVFTKIDLNLWQRS